MRKPCPDPEKRNGPNKGWEKRDGFIKHSGVAQIGMWSLNELRADRKNLG